MEINVNFIRTGTPSTILWGEAHFVGDELFWCCPECEAPVKVPVPVTGEANNGPFFLVSKQQSPSSLEAVTTDSYLKLSTIVCLHKEKTVETCLKKSKILDGNPEWASYFGGDFH